MVGRGFDVVMAYSFCFAPLHAVRWLRNHHKVRCPSSFGQRNFAGSRLYLSGVMANLEKEFCVRRLH
jgi:hypothetical protein